MAASKEAVETMSAETRHGRAAGGTVGARSAAVLFAWVFGVGWAVGGLVGGFAEVRGPAACLRRDALFRRLLLVADVVAVVGAFLLTVGLSRRSVQLTWVGVAAVPILLVGAKLTGLYDRDETLLRKTTLDEAPQFVSVGDVVFVGGVVDGWVVGAWCA